MQMKSLLTCLISISLASAVLANTTEVIDVNGNLKIGPADKSSSASMSGGMNSEQDFASQLKSLPPDIQQKIEGLPPEQQKAILKAMKGMGSTLPGQQQPAPAPFQQQTITPPQKNQLPPAPGAPAGTQDPALSQLDSPSSPSDSNDNANRNSTPNTALSAPSSGGDGDLMGQPGS